jgi:hypothetical protein
MGGVVGRGQFPVSAFYKRGCQEEYFAPGWRARRQFGASTSRIRGKGNGFPGQRPSIRRMIRSALVLRGVSFRTDCQTPLLVKWIWNIGAHEGSPKECKAFRCHSGLT